MDIAWNWHEIGMSEEVMYTLSVVLDFEGGKMF